MDGGTSRLEVYPHENLQQALTNFIEDNKLPAKLLPALYKKVSTEFQKNVSNNSIDGKDSEKMSLEELQFDRLRISPELGMRKLKVAKTFSVKTPSSKTEPRLIEPSVNQSCFERLHSHGKRKQERIERLRQDVLQQRDELRKSSSFRYGTMHNT